MKLNENNDKQIRTKIVFDNLEKFSSIGDISEAFEIDCERMPRVGGQTGAAIGHQLDGVHLLARALLSLIEQIAAASGIDSVKMRNRYSAAGLAERIYAERVRRNSHFPPGLFGEPAWDILLDLFAAGERRELRAVKEVCINSHVPDATALRYIAQLVAHGLVKHRPDRTDNRRKFLELTAEGRRCAASYLESMSKFGDEANDIATALFQTG